VSAPPLSRIERAVLIVGITLTALGGVIALVATALVVLR
jgi:hypothetical protein